MPPRERGQAPGPGGDAHADQQDRGDEDDGVHRRNVAGAARSVRRLRGLTRLLVRDVALPPPRPRSGASSTAASRVHRCSDLHVPVGPRCQTLLEHQFGRRRSQVLQERVDEPAALLLAAVAAVRTTPAPLGAAASRLRVLAHAAEELHGIYLQAVAEADRDGTAAELDCRGVADVLSQVVGLPVSRARSDSWLADRLSRLPGLLDAVATGEVPVAAARLVARAWAALPSRCRDTPTAQALITVAGAVDLAELQGQGRRAGRGAAAGGDRRRPRRRARRPGPQPGRRRLPDLDPRGPGPARRRGAARGAAGPRRRRARRPGGHPHQRPAPPRRAAVAGARCPRRRAGAER